jgi:hypothetical protein
MMKIIIELSRILFSLAYNKRGWSIFVDSDCVFDFRPTNRTVFEWFRTLQAGCIMLARHIKSISIVFTANNTRVIVGFFFQHAVLLIACICWGGPDFESCFMAQQKLVWVHPLLRQPQPWSN